MASSENRTIAYNLKVTSRHPQLDHLYLQRHIGAIVNNLPRVRLNCYLVVLCLGIETWTFRFRI